MEYDGTFIQIDEARAETPLSTTGQLSEEIDERRAYGSGEAKLGGFIAVIESRTFIRECIRRSVQSAFPQPVLAYSTAVELGQQHLLTSLQLIIFSWVEDNAEASTNALKVLSERAPKMPVIVLAYNNDAELGRTAICRGAKGYIPLSLGFEITIEAVRFVLAGGTYVPMECVLATGWSGIAAAPPSPSVGAVTGRELAVVRAIQQGKSNKVIAYDLNMCESTVKVHVRNIMKKLKARNRTEVAIKAQTVLSPTPLASTRFEFSTPNSLGLLNSSDKNDNPAIRVLADPFISQLNQQGGPGARLVIAHATLEAQRKGERGGEIVGEAGDRAIP